MHFLAILLLFWTRMFFSETRDLDLSNGLRLVSAYAFWKNPLVDQGQPYAHPNLENHEDRKFWPDLGLRQAHFSPISCADAQFSTLNDS